MSFRSLRLEALHLLGGFDPTEERDTKCQFSKIGALRVGQFEVLREKSAGYSRLPKKLNFMLLGLASARDDWELRWDMETELIRRLSVTESMQQLEALYQEFRQDLETTESLFSSQRFEAMAELQNRLRQLKS